MSHTHLWIVSMFLSLLLLSLLGAVTEASWTQQYGDCSSTSYIPFKGTIDTEWRYLGPRASLDNSKPHSPSVSMTNGNIYLGLQSRLLAISSEGAVLREYDVQQRDAEYYLETSNVVFSEKHQTVVVIAAGDTSDHEGGQELTRISALDPSSGKVLWYKGDIKLIATNWLVLSEKQGLIYVIGLKGFSAIDIKTGSIAWTQQMPWSNLILMSPIFARVSDELDLMLLPVVPGVNDGVLYAVNTANGKLLWKQTLGFSYDGSFVISPTNGVIYGCTGLFSDVSHGKDIIILNAKDGKILYSGAGHCSGNDTQVMTPSVDNEGNGYYSCGNQIFSVKSGGELRWVSASYGSESLPPHIPVSIRPDGTLFYVTINQTSILTLSHLDGSLIKSYTGSPGVMISQPPILLGDQYMYIVGLAQESTAYIYPMKQ